MAEQAELLQCINAKPDCAEYHLANILLVSAVYIRTVMTIVLHMTEIAVPTVSLLVVLHAFSEGFLALMSVESDLQGVSEWL